VAPPRMHLKFGGDIFLTAVLTMQSRLILSDPRIQAYTRLYYSPAIFAGVWKPGQRDFMNNKEVSMKLWQVLVAAFVLGMILVAVPPAYKHYHPQLSLPLVALFDFIERLGDAVLIAVVIGGGIERIIRKKEFRDYALDSFVSYFGRMLPPQLREGIRSYLEISIIRTRWDIVYDIEEWPAKPGYLKLDTKIEYDMQNRSEAPADYDFVYEVEDSLCPGIAETAITYIRLDKNVYDSEQQLADLVKSKNGQKVVHQSIGKLQPYNAFKQPTYTFHAQSTECFEKYFVSPLSASYPTVKTEFTVWYDKTKFNVLFEVTHGDAPPPQSVSNNSKTGERWAITKPILPGQGFVIRCGFKAPTAQEHAATQVV